MKSYDKHLQSTQAEGTAVDVRRKPCFRSSAAFVALQQGSISTRILFLGYWLVKRSLQEVNILVTLRNGQGEVVQRTSIIVDQAKAYTIYLQQLLEGGGLDPKADFSGSIECEVFSTRDMVFPYPAIVLNYFTPTSMAAVHTAGRIFNDIEDMSENTETAVPESGFDVLANERFRPFFNFVNGPFAETGKKVRYELIGENNQRETGEILLGDIPSFGAVHVDLREPVSRLGSGRGAMKIFHDLKGFFPRFVAGNHDLETDAFSITHTYYDCTAQEGEGDYWSNDDDRLFDSMVFVPVWADDKGLYTEVVFYPIFSPTNFRIHLEFFDIDGERLGEVRDWRTVDTSDQGIFTANVEEIISRHLDEHLLGQVCGMKIIKEWEPGEKIPTRLKFGLNVGVRGGQVDLPTNICFNSKIANPAMLKKPTCFRWVPLLNHANSVIAISNASFVKDGHGTSNVELTFYREQDTETLNRKAIVPENGQLRIDLAEESEVREFLNDGSGWIVVRGDNPFVETWYFEFSETGAVGGDHGF